MFLYILANVWSSLQKLKSILTASVLWSRRHTLQYLCRLWPFSDDSSWGPDSYAVIKWPNREGWQIPDPVVMYMWSEFSAGYLSLSQWVEGSWCQHLWPHSWRSKGAGLVREEWADAQETGSKALGQYMKFMQRDSEPSILLGLWGISVFHLLNTVKESLSSTWPERSLYQLLRGP